MAPSAPVAPPSPGAQILALVRVQCEHWDRAAPPGDLLAAAQHIWTDSGLAEDAFLAKLRVGMLRASVLKVPDGELRTAAWLRMVADQTIPAAESRT